MTVTTKPHPVLADTIRAGDEIIPDPLRPEETTVVAGVNKSQFSSVIVLDFIWEGQVADATVQKTDHVWKI